MHTFPAVSTADTETARAPISLPQALRGPLSERVSRVRDDAGELRTYRVAVRDWVPVADERYRCCTWMRSPNEQAPAVRVGVKDTIDVAGLPTRFGLPHHRRYPAETAPILAGLPVEALFAKLATTQLSVGRVAGCVNPYFPALDPAGSSTGSAVAVAANICDVAVGTDVLGSVRFPAGCCGVAALRMTQRDGLSRGSLTVSPMLDAPGWIARTIADLAYAWESLGLRRSSADVPRAGTGVVGVVAEAFDEDCDDEVRAALRTATELVEAAGLTVRQVELSSIWHARADAWRLCAYDTHDLGKRWKAAAGAEFDDATRAAFEIFERVDPRDHEVARRAVRRVRATVGGLFTGQGVDAWLMPLSLRLPVPLGAIPATVATVLDPSESRFEQRLGFTSLASVAGLPAVCFPIGVHPRLDVPVPVQLVGPPGSETTLLRTAARIAAPVDLNLLPR